MNCQTLKSKIRREKLEARQLLSQSKCDEKSREICFKAFTNFFLLKKEVALYYPIKNEVNPFFLMDLGVSHTSLPFALKDKMIFKEWREGDDLSVSSFGMKEPLEIANNIIPEIIIVPLVSFDKNNNRIGYGGGYYDKFLGGFNGITIGFAYEIQKVDKIPTESFDIKLDYIVTEKNIYE